MDAPTVTVIRAMNAILAGHDVDVTTVRAAVGAAEKECGPTFASDDEDASPAAGASAPNRIEGRSTQIIQLFLHPMPYFIEGVRKALDRLETEDRDGAREAIEDALFRAGW
ncbi:MAG TPA: hypothetical protein VEN82_02730 [Actinomycetota bacterium]|nr:hypothetical protein [Actinomycetota bacterium]